MALPGLVAAKNLADVADRERAWDSLGVNIEANFGPLWEPSEADVLSWYDATDISQFTLNGNQVLQWRDKGSTANHANVIITPPVYNSSQFNGLGGVLLAGTTETNGGLLRNSFSNVSNLFVVAIAADGEQSIMSFGNNGASNVTRIDISRGRWIARDGSSVFVNFPSTSSGVNTYTYYFESSQHNMNRNGGDYTTRSVVGGWFPTFGRIGGYAPNLLVSQIIVLPSSSLELRQKLEGWAAYKYNIFSKLPPGHPYRTTPPRP
jgi:hypothetical protein